MEKVLVHTTWGPTDPTRAGLAFAYAMVSKKQGAEVEIFLFHDAVLLARKQMYPLAVPIRSSSNKRLYGVSFGTESKNICLQTLL